MELRKRPTNHSYVGGIGCKLDNIFVSINKQQNASSDVSNNSSENQIVYPMTDHHAPIVRLPDPETGEWLPVSPQQQDANT